MAVDAEAVVFVGLPDIARLTKLTPQRVRQLNQERERPNPVLPDPDALINGEPFWSLTTLVPRLEAAGYSINADVLKTLETERGVPRDTVPIGAVEAVEILGRIPMGTFQSRKRNKSIAQPLFTTAQISVWDLDELVASATERGFVVDEKAAATWRIRNGSGGPVRREVERLVRVRLSVPAIDDDAGVAKADEYLRNVLLSAGASDRVRVLNVEIQAVP